MPHMSLHKVFEVGNLQKSACPSFYSKIQAHPHKLRRRSYSLIGIFKAFDELMLDL